MKLTKIAEMLTKEVHADNWSPADVTLDDPFPTTQKEQGLANVYLNPQVSTVKSTKITAAKPENYNIVAIDSTGFTLGLVDEGLIGSVRISVVSRRKDTKVHHLDSYGPFNFAVTNENRQEIFDKLYKEVYDLDQDPTRKAPDTQKMLERIRAILERHAQMEVAKNFPNSIILLDGSFIGGTQDTPEFFMPKMINIANQKNSIPIAVSKETNLTLKSSGKSILSLLEKEKDSCYIGPLNRFIDQDPGRYKGDIFVAKLKTFGESFRIDIPKGLSMPTEELFSYISGIAGDFGYPEELKLAHTTCVLSSIEILECQAAAMEKYKMRIEPDMHERLFTPFR